MSDDAIPFVYRDDLLPPGTLDRLLFALGDDHPTPRSIARAIYKGDACGEPNDIGSLTQYADYMSKVSDECLRFTDSLHETVEADPTAAEVLDVMYLGTRVLAVVSSFATLDYSMLSRFAAETARAAAERAERNARNAPSHAGRSRRKLRDRAEFLHERARQWERIADDVQAVQDAAGDADDDA